MSTGSFENWTGTITDIGAIYPFVGTEFLLFIIGMVFWIVWSIWQARHENRTYDEEVKKFGSAESLNKVIAGQRPENP